MRVRLVVGLLFCALGVLSLAGCGGGGFASERPATIFRTSLQAGLGARSVRETSVYSYLGGRMTVTLQTDRRGSAGTVQIGGTRAWFEIVNGRVYLRSSSRAGATLLGVRLPKAVHLGWLRLPSIPPQLALGTSISTLFKAVDRVSTRGDTLRASKAGSGAVRVSDRSAHIDVALTKPHYPLATGGIVDGISFEAHFTDWNAPIRISPPAHWTSLAALQARRTRVHVIAPTNGTVVPTPAGNGMQRFHAVGVRVEFDYPGDFDPLQIISSHRVGSLHGTDFAVGLGSNLALLVTHFTSLPIPVTTENVAVLAPEFERSIDAIAGQRVAVRVGSRAGHALLDFAAFRNGSRLDKIYNLFSGDDMDEVQCLYSVELRAQGQQMCHEMRATLRLAGR